MTEKKDKFDQNAMNRVTDKVLAFKPGKGVGKKKDAGESQSPVTPQSTAGK